MEEKDSLIDDIRKDFEVFFEDIEPEFDKNNPSVPLVFTPYGADEVLESIESLLSTYVTQGKKVGQFEEEWSDYLATSYGVMTNSGSSANLLAIKAISDTFSEDAEVITPAVTWSTAVFPILDAGAKPVLVDVDPDELIIDIDSVKDAINENTEVIMLVHILGNPAEMEELLEICDENDIILVEDCAEAHGAKYRGEYVGTFGKVGAFSFSFSHHITTMEGGIAVTEDQEIAERMSIAKSWGRTEKIKSKGNNLGFSFERHGYNLRPTEVQAAMGIHQIPRLKSYVEERRQNAKYMNSKLRSLEDINVLEERDSVKCSYLHYPLVLSESCKYSQKELREFLEEQGIETRPILSGNLATHPVFKQDNIRIEGNLSGAKTLHDKGLYISCHPYLTENHMDYMVKSIKKFFET